MNKDLRWLAENVSEWSCHYGIDKVRRCALGVEFYNSRLASSTGGITFDEWLAAREELEAERMDIIGQNGNDGQHYAVTKPPALKLIGIAGKARSGKDTAANYLAHKHGLIRYSFATPMKAAIKTMFGLTDRHVDGDLKETELPWLGVSPRRIMQTLGTEWARDTIRQDLWVLLAQREWQQMKEPTDDTFHAGMIIPDVRFEDEADFIRRNGGLVIHIERDSAPKIESHKSESGVQPVYGDPIILNNGSLDDLYRAMSEVIQA